MLIENEINLYKIFDNYQEINILGCQKLFRGIVSIEKDSFILCELLTCSNGLNICICESNFNRYTGIMSININGKIYLLLKIKLIFVYDNFIEELYIDIEFTNLILVEITIKSKNSSKLKYKFECNYNSVECLYSLLCIIIEKNKNCLTEIKEFINILNTKNLANRKKESEELFNEYFQKCKRCICIKKRIKNLNSRETRKLSL